MSTCTLGQGLTLTLIGVEWWIHAINERPTNGLRLRDPIALASALKKAEERLRIHLPAEDRN